MTDTLASVETFIIHPSNKYNRLPSSSTVALHNLDLLSAPIHIRNHRFFHRPQSLTPADVINRLKSSLAEALELYPPVAGMVQPNEDGNLRIVMHAESNVGTPFIAEMKDSPFMDETEDLSARLDMVLPPSSSTLAVKVTQFSCGTIVVATSIHHQVVDLSGYLDFLEVWAELARGETIDFTRIPHDWSHTPGRFFSGLNRKLSVTASPPGFKALPNLPTCGSPFIPAEVTRWRFTKSAVERLKNELSSSVIASNEQDNLQSWISSGDALAALSWGAITRARHNKNLTRSQVFGGSSIESQTETMAMAADGRHRSPQGNMLNRQYFGNFNVLPSITVSRSDLLSASCESAGRIALKIRNDLTEQLSPEAIADKLSFMENTPTGQLAWSADVALTNWCRFDLQGAKFDFGWGKPFRATAGSSGVFPPGYVLMMQNKNLGDIFVMITVEQEGANELKADSLLNKYGTLVPDF